MRLKRSGFTLIELLVVIAIIALLAAILFPVFARARENARRSSCQSNLKQLCLGVIQYRQDYDERFPVGYYYSSATATYTTWGEEVQPYVKSGQIFKCPSSTNTVVYAGVNGLNGNANDYGINAAITQFWKPSGAWDNSNLCIPNNIGPVIESEIDEPVRTTLLIDANYFAYGSHWKENQFGINKRHLEGYNVAFVDGHVKFLKTLGATQGGAGTYIYDPRSPTSATGLGGCPN